MENDETTDDPPKGRVEYARFAVVDRAACVWDGQLKHTNLEFLRAVDPDYFVYQAQVHLAAHARAEAEDNSEVALRAALSLRVARGMATETLFGFLGAVMQAWHCVFGWLALYRNDELRVLAASLNEGKPLKAFRMFRPVTWETVGSRILGPLRDEDAARYEALLPRFAKAWRILADELIDDDATREYNRLKHSFRVQAATQLQFRIEHEGQALFESTSKLGHVYPYLKPVAGRKAHHDVHRAVTTLNPSADAAAIVVAAVTVHNLVSLARALCGDAKDASLRYPDDDQLFDALEDPSSPLRSLRYGGTWKVAKGEYATESEIFAIYGDDESSEIDDGAEPADG